MCLNVIKLTNKIVYCEQWEKQEEHFFLLFNRTQAREWVSLRYVVMIDRGLWISVPHLTCLETSNKKKGFCFWSLILLSWHSYKVQCMILSGKRFHLSQSVQFPDWKVLHTPADSILSGPITNWLSILCFLMEILSYANTKKKRERKRKLMDFKLSTFIGRFKVIPWHWQG